MPRQSMQCHETPSLNVYLYIFYNDFLPLLANYHVLTHEVLHMHHARPVHNFSTCRSDKKDRHRVKPHGHFVLHRYVRTHQQSVVIFKFERGSCMCVYVYTYEGRFYSHDLCGKTWSEQLLLYSLLILFHPRLLSSTHYISFMMPASQFIHPHFAGHDATPFKGRHFLPLKSATWAFEEMTNIFGMTWEQQQQQLRSTNFSEFNQIHCRFFNLLIRSQWNIWSFLVLLLWKGEKL